MNLQKELGELRDEFAGKKAQWDNEKTSVERLQKIREEIEQVNQEIQKSTAFLQFGTCGRIAVRQTSTADKTVGGRGKESERAGSFISA